MVSRCRAWLVHSLRDLCPADESSAATTHIDGKHTNTNVAEEPNPIELECLEFRAKKAPTAAEGAVEQYCMALACAENGKPLTATDIPLVRIRIGVSRDQPLPVSNCRAGCPHAAAVVFQAMIACSKTKLPLDFGTDPYFLEVLQATARRPMEVRLCGR